MPEPGKVYPNASIKGLRWSFPDDLAAVLAEGLVVKLEIIARIDELREHNDGSRWNVEVLEIRDSHE